VAGGSVRVILSVIHEPWLPCQTWFGGRAGRSEMMKVENGRHMLSPNCTWVEFTDLGVETEDVV
jgi:hypothetical protein